MSDHTRRRFIGALGVSDPVDARQIRLEPPIVCRLALPAMFLTGAPPRFGAMPRVSRLDVMSTLFRPAPGSALLVRFPGARRTLARMNTCDQDHSDEKKKEAMS